MSIKMDWNELWKIARREASLERHQRDKVKFWNKRAEQYDNASHNPEKRIAQICNRLDINKETTVLDVGAGTGVLAIPLAKLAGKVTAVDPSAGMLDKLRTAAAWEGLDNITCLEEKWEDVTLGKDIKPHDLVLASFSLIMPDIEAALEKMDAAAKKAVCIFWFAGPLKGANEDLYPKLFGEPYSAGPDYIYLLNILYQMDIYPDVEVRASSFKHFYNDIEEALGDICGKLDVDRPGDIAVVREYLEGALQREKKGFYLERPSRTAMLWWWK